MKLIICPSKFQDWKTIQKLNHQIMSINQQFDPYFNPDWEFTDFGIKYFKARTADKNGCCFIAELNHQPVGYLNGFIKSQGYRLTTIKVAELENIAVLPEFQSQGIGSQLITEFKKWAKKQNVTHININVFYQNKQAIKLYKKLGLKPIDITFEGKI